MHNHPIYFLVTLWGEKHREYFYSLCAPTLLAPNNVPILKDRPGCKIVIATTVEDWDDLKNRPLIKRLGEYIEFFHIDIGLPGDTPPLLHAAKGLRLGCRKAYEDRAVAGWLAPDLLLSDGLVAMAVGSIDAGKKVVLRPVLRFAMEPVLESLAAAGSLRPDQPMALSAQSLSAIAVNSLHTDLLRYDFDCEEFGDAPAWTFWRVPGRNGFILYTVSWAPLFADVSAIPDFQDRSLDSSAAGGLLDQVDFGHLQGTEHVTLLNDSYNGMVMSLTPSSETVLDGTGARPFNRHRDRFGLGVARRLSDIHRFHYGSGLDPLQRRLHAVPVFVHGGPIDDAYQSVVAKTQLTMQHATAPGSSSAVRQYALLISRTAKDLACGVRSSFPTFDYRALIARTHRPIAYLKIPFKISADIFAGRKSIRYVAGRLLKAAGIGRSSNG